MKYKAVFLGVSVSFLFHSVVFATIETNRIFQSGMVLQRNMPVPVWGTSTRENEKVTVKFGSRAVSTFVKGGKWMVRLPAMPASNAGHRLEIVGDNTVTYEDVLVGEVWLCSGQSNMNFRLSMAQPDHVENYEAEIAAAKFPKVRLFTVAEGSVGAPAENVSGKWQVCEPTAAADFSAVGYFFGSELHKHLRGVPVGLIAAAVGGTRVEAWTLLKTLKGMPEGQGHAAGYENALEVFKKGGRGDPHTDINLCSGGLLNKMIIPLVPLAMRGVIWYQGESNVDHAVEYGKLFPAMVADWRGLWGRKELPFLYAQIAPFHSMPPEIREAQFLSLGRIPNSAMVVTTDVGDANNIHPTRKRPVGERFVLAARGVAYGERIEYSGPLFQRVSFANGKASVVFGHVGKGLVAKGGELKGFVLAGKDQKFYPARAVIVGEKVEVSSEQVTEPIAVRYGWANVPDVNLFNREGLPASPFRSDMPK